MRIPDPALVLLVGAAGSGKSTWAASRFRAAEVVSSDALRGVVGSGPGDLDASEDAFRLLDQIVEGRCRRGLTVVVDTLGLDPEDGVIWVYGVDDDDGTLAFTDEGVEEVRLLLEDYCPVRPSKS